MHTTRAPAGHRPAAYDAGVRQPHVIETPSGPAHADVGYGTDPTGLLVLGPGASGATGAVDLAMAVEVAGRLGVSTALVTPAYRVAGRTVPPRGPSVDEAWLACVRSLVSLRLLAPQGAPLIVGGRSFGGRVAARTAIEAGADAVLCLAYPLHPPGRPQASRLGELDAAGDLPTLVISGDRDPFGRPEPGPGREVVVVAGDHSLRKGLPVARQTLSRWLAGVLNDR